MNHLTIKNDSGLLALALRLVVGWTYFSAFWRRTVLAPKLDPEFAGYIGKKFNHFLPNALGIKPLIEYLVEHPDILWINMLAFTIIEGLVGLSLMLGAFTRLMSIGVIGLALGILLGSGWIGTTCLDEWQIGVLGIAAGFVLFLTGSGKYSMDGYWLQKQYPFTQKKYFAWLGSGSIPIKTSIFPKVVLISSLVILGITLGTNHIFHGGLWGKLHNKSVKPKLEISQGKINENKLSFQVYRTEGVDVYGSWLIKVEVFDAENKEVIAYHQEDLAQLESHQIENKYVSKIEPGKHSLVIPLGAKATLSFKNEQFKHLSKGNYKLKLTDISGASWSHQLVKS